ncbi:MAG: carboxypeptidase-like regulatory domain-containing protein [Pirellulales bacterium]
MTIRWSRFCVVAATLCVVALVGCGGPYDSSVSGMVTLDGQAVPRGTVSYQPKAGGPAAYARIENGSYVMRTGREEGLPSGDYYVTVTANEPSAVARTEGGGPPPPGKPITPMWYRTKDTSGLSFMVEPGDNEIDLELKSPPPPGWNPRAHRSG